MPQPYNYNIAQPQLDQSYLQGLSSGYAIQDRQTAMQEKQAAKEQQQQMRERLANAQSRQDYINVMMDFPQLAEQLKAPMEMMDADKKRQVTLQGARILSALDSGSYDLAKQELESIAQAAEAAGDTEYAKGLRLQAKILETSPEAAKISANAFMASVVPEEYAKTQQSLQETRRATALEPAALQEQQAKAQKAATESKYAESKAILELKEKGWNIEKLSQDYDIARQNQRIALMEKAKEKEMDELKKQELQQKIDAANEARDQSIRQKDAEAQSAMAFTTNSLNTIDKLLSNDELENVVGAIQGSGLWPSRLLGAAQDITTNAIPALFDEDGGKLSKRSDALALIETVQGQQFLDNLMAVKKQGATFGALTDREGTKLEAYVTSLKTAQSDKQFIESLNNIKQLLQKTQNSMIEQYGIKPEVTEVDVVEVDGEIPSAGTIVDDLVAKYGGK